MKLFTARTLFTYGHVIFPALAGVLGLAALSAQWIENHRLRTELEKMDKARTASTQACLMRLETQYGRQKAYVKELNQWVSSMNQYTEELAQRADQARKTAAEATQVALYRAQAQSISSMHQAGTAAGIQWRGLSKEALMKEVMHGAAPKDGPFTNVFFEAPAVPETELPSVAKYLEYVPGKGLICDDRAMLAAVDNDLMTPPPPMPKFPDMP